MRSKYWDLGQLSRGDVVTVTLEGNTANVRLMSPADFQSYKAGGAHRYVGGLSQQSPVHLTVPASGPWFLTVDLDGLVGTVRAEVAVARNKVET